VNRYTHSQRLKRNADTAVMSCAPALIFFALAAIIGGVIALLAAVTPG
jgi:hypothetical protein